MAFLEQIEFFHGDVSEHRALVYARCDQPSFPSDAVLTAHLVGPFSELSRTLTSKVAFKDAGPGESKLWVAHMPDPCVWSSDLPAFYRVSMSLARNGSVMETREQIVGLRGWGVRGRSLYHQSVRWVARGVSDQAVFTTPTADWREAHAVRVVRKPTAELLNEATRLGVLLLVVVEESGAAALHEVQRVATHPAVVAVALADPAGIGSRPRRRAPNLLFAQWFAENANVQPAPWAEFALASVGDRTTFGNRIANCSLPIIAVDAAIEKTDLPTARRQCDHLQRELALIGDFAGYVIDFQN